MNQLSVNFDHSGQHQGHTESSWRPGSGAVRSSKVKAVKLDWREVSRVRLSRFVTSLTSWVTCQQTGWRKLLSQHRLSQTAVTQADPSSPLLHSHNKVRGASSSKKETEESASNRDVKNNWATVRCSCETSMCQAVLTEYWQPVWGEGKYRWQPWSLCWPGCTVQSGDVLVSLRRCLRTPDETGAGPVNNTNSISSLKN